MFTSCASVMLQRGDVIASSGAGHRSADDEAEWLETFNDDQSYWDIVDKYPAVDYAVN